VSLIYWVGSIKTDAELVLPKHGIFSPQMEAFNIYVRHQKQGRRYMLHLLYAAYPFSSSSLPLNAILGCP